jgi:hypothetical protein
VTDDDIRAVASTLLLVTACACAVFLHGCASGPQVVPVTPVTTLTVNVYAVDGGTVRFGEMWIDGTSADGHAAAQGVDVDAETDVSVETEVGLAP